ncbi:unnamed protein product [Paramecium sonneborni]|uniref:Uncharacterized protein n=1 Tax=Paramecium sonneborni TaxID=65129 RepID=A0A8S1RR48_9CILI|nr:unnamed protein product [Paramecium sonneborni]
MIKQLNEDFQYIERDYNYIQGTISLKFKFKGKELEYNYKDCYIKANNQIIDCQTEIILPIDLDINYSFSIGNGDSVRVEEDMDYIVDSISDLEETNNIYVIDGFSQFQISNLAISPNEKFILFLLKIIIIDLMNQKIRKVLYKSYFIQPPQPSFSNDCSLAFINISKNSTSRFLLLNLSDGIINQNIIQLKHQAEIFELPLNLEKLTVQKSRIISYQPKEFFEFTDHYEQPILHLLGNRLALILDVYGQQFVCRINQQFKVIKYYNTNEQQILYQIFKNILVVASDLFKSEYFLKDISTGKLIRKIKMLQYQERMQSFYSNKTYFLQIQKKSNNFDFFCNNKICNWIIFDLLRGTETQREIINLTNKPIRQEKFSRNLTVQNFDNKIIYNLKH